ncbi:MAG: hypothetical protein NTV43_16650 [Methylococcales bacterium]|nr:hypothetical protein [Methylococcales bacterium]
MLNIKIEIITLLIAIIFAWPLASPFIEKILTWPLIHFFNYKNKYGDKAEEKAGHHANVIFLLIISVVIIIITLFFS